MSSYELKTPLNRVSIKVPFTVLEVVDRIIQYRLGDGESNISRPAIIIELLKIGARVEKKKMDNIESGANPFDNRIEEQLSYIAKAISSTKLQLNVFFNIYAELQKVDRDLFNRIKENTTLSDDELTLLKRLFVDIKS